MGGPLWACQAVPGWFTSNNPNPGKCFRLCILWISKGSLVHLHGIFQTIKFQIELFIIPFDCFQAMLFSMPQCSSSLCLFLAPGSGPGFEGFSSCLPSWLKAQNHGSEKHAAFNGAACGNNLLCMRTMSKVGILLPLHLGRLLVVEA